jgi:hypothetical protein
MSKRNYSHEDSGHKAPWNSRKYCPVDLEIKDRNVNCGKSLLEDGIFCEFCPEFIEKKQITFRGFKYARAGSGTKEPCTEPHDLCRDNRFRAQPTSQAFSHHT